MHLICRKCDYYNRDTDVVGERTRIDFYGKLGELDNFIVIDIYSSEWQVSMYIYTFAYIHAYINT